MLGGPYPVQERPLFVATYQIVVIERINHCFFYNEALVLPITRCNYHRAEIHHLNVQHRKSVIFSISRVNLITTRVII